MNVVADYAARVPGFQCSSASRKFLNLEITQKSIIISDAFQCSSASRKFLNCTPPVLSGVRGVFQCSSASRKFLNTTAQRQASETLRVSVLFSEPKIPQPPTAALSLHEISVSVLFSEPKIPQLWLRERMLYAAQVSVLFSEPKIPQLEMRLLPRQQECRFSALQRAENSSTGGRGRRVGRIWRFSALQRAENSSTVHLPLPSHRCRVSVLFSEPKIPQRDGHLTQRCIARLVSVLFSEPKIPQEMRY